MTLEDLVRECFPDVREAKQEGECFVCCPFCVDNGEPRNDTRYRLGINYQEGTWNCWNCGYKGRLAPEKLFHDLCEKFELEYRFSWRDKRSKKKIEKKKKELHETRLPQAFEPLWKKSSDRVHRKALHYLLDRGVTEKQIERHMIGFCAVGEYGGRIIVPVYYRGKVCGFVGRAFLKDLEPKYYNSEGLKYLWGVPDQKHRKAALLEGIFDALSAERALKKVDCLARLGRTITDEQLTAIKQYEEVILFPDPDVPGANGAIATAKAIEEANRKINISIVLPRSGDQDVGDSSKSEVRKLYHSRKRWSGSVARLLRARTVF